mmetsp:Transcript_11953/g.51466  ORF Transcript_11953/g.51466 Transcript_11953/m.51466 type:complete len:189 (-) Transcript_11953:1119-1685(-)
MATPLSISEIDVSKITLDVPRRAYTYKIRDIKYNDKPLVLRSPEMVAPFGVTQFRENERFNLCVYLDDKNEEHTELKNLLDEISSIVKNETDADVRELVKSPSEQYDARIDLTLDVKKRSSLPDILDLNGATVDELKPNSSVKSIIHVQHVFLKGSEAIIKLACVALKVYSEPEEATPLELCDAPFEA